MSVPGILQEGRRSNPTRCPQADGPARGRCQAQARQAQGQTQVSFCCAATGCEMSRLRAIARSLRVPQSQNARCTLMTVGVWVGGSIVTIVLAAKPLYCSLGLVCDPLVQKLVFRALLGLWMRVLRSLCFFGRYRPRAKEGQGRVACGPGATATLEPTFAFKRAVYDA